MISLEEYQELSLPYYIGRLRPLYSEGSTPKTLSLKLLGHKTKKEIAGTVIFGDHCEGPPSHAHGGMISYVLDESMGTAAWNAQYPVVAQNIQITFRRMVPLHQTLFIHAAVTRNVKHLVYVAAKITDKENNVYSSSIGKFHILTETQLKKLHFLVQGAAE